MHVSTMRSIQLLSVPMLSSEVTAFLFDALLYIAT